MIRELIHDPLFLALPSRQATVDDLPIAADLLDTLKAHEKTCVGMAANMIGIRKRIIAIRHEGEYLVLFNPVILKKEAPFDSEEGCLSLLGGPRPVRRFRKIKVAYETAFFRGKETLLEKRVKSFSGFSAEIIQHEIDHCEGILI